MTPTRRILVIDDEDAVREVIQGCFEDVAEWEVLTASSGQEGLDKVVRDRPNAIVLDVMMSAIDGITFLQQLATLPDLPFIPVVLLTANLDLVDFQSLPKGLVVGAIAKPFDPLLLVKQVARLLNWETKEI